MNTIQPPPFILVMGCPHSGLSLMQAILGSHSNIYALSGETRVFFLKSEPREWELRKFYNLVFENGKQRWVDKTPEHIQYLGAILETYNPLIVVMSRDARDVVASLNERDEYDVESAIERWISDNAVALSFANHSRVMLVKYEDVVTDFEDTIKGVFDFLGEQYEPQVKEFHKFQEKVRKPRRISDRKSILALRKWQISRPLYDGRGKRKKLKNYEIELVNKLCNGTMLRLGYENDNS